MSYELGPEKIWVMYDHVNQVDTEYRRADLCKSNWRQHKDFCRSVIAAELLADNTGTPEDLAYDRAIQDCLDALQRSSGPLKETTPDSVSGEPT